MASSKEFKQAVREGRLNDAFVIAMGNAPELHITTWIASPKDNEDNEDNNSQPRSGECLRTHVNLVEGEIINEIGEQLIEDDLYGTLQKFHLQQVTQGHQTISHNLQSIQQMFRLLAILQKQQKGEEYNAINTWKMTGGNALLTPLSSPLIGEGGSTPVLTNTSWPPTSAPNKSFPPKSSPEDPNLPLIVESNDFPFSDDNEDNEEDVIEDLLSLDELDIDIEQAENEPNIKQSPKNGEDWGDWLNEDESEINTGMLDLESLDLDESEDWQEDWEDETEFMSNTTINKKDEG